MTSRIIRQDSDFIKSSDLVNRSMDDIDLQNSDSDSLPEEHVLTTGRQSEKSSHTFRDTEVSHQSALNTMRISSLSSIVNFPKKESLMKKLGKAIKDQVKGKKHMHTKVKYVYKNLQEKDVPSSLHIPKVSFPKDF